MSASLTCLPLLAVPFLLTPWSGATPDPDPGAARSVTSVEVGRAVAVPTLDDVDPGSQEDVEPASLAVVEPLPAELLAMGLADVCRGRYESGLGHLEAGAAMAHADLEFEEIAPRLDRALARTRALITVRDAWLAAVTAGGVKIKVPIDGKLKTVAVSAVADGKIKFQRGFGKITSWPVDGFDAELLAMNVGSKVGDYGETWTRGWAYLLAGNDKWAKYLKGDKSVLEQIKADADDVPGLLRQGHGLHAFAKLAANPMPTDVASAEAILADIEFVRQEAKGTDAYHEREENLKALTFRSLELRAEATDLGELLVADVQDLGGGRVRIEYDFQSADQLKDFVIQPLLMADRFPEDQTQVAAEDSSVTVEDGSLAFFGRIGILHQLQFEGPMIGEFEVTYSEDIGDTAGPFPLMHMGVAATADGERRAAVMDFRGAEAITDKGRVYFYAKEPEPIEEGETYSCLITIDDQQTMEASVDGAPFDPFTEIGSTYGAAFFTAQTAQENYLERMAFEGTPRATSLMSLRAHWVSQRMESMGW